MLRRLNSSRTWLFLAVVTAGLGAWLSGELVKRHAGIWPESVTSLYAGVCRAAAALGGECAPAGESAELTLPVPWYSSTDGLTVRHAEVPIAFGGLAYFVSLVTWLLIAGPARSGPGWWGGAPRALVTFGVLASIGMLGTMAAGAAKLCGVCVLIHALNLLTAGAVVRMERATKIAVNDRAVLSTTQARLARVAFAVSLLIVAGLWYHRREQLALAKRMHALMPYRDMVVALRSDAEFLLREHFAQPVGVADTRMTDATNREPAQLVVFTDYVCPACRCTARRIERMIAPSFADGLQVTVRHFPLCRACNGADVADVHPGACDAAYAAEAARIVGGDSAFARMRALLYAHRGPFGAESLSGLAQQTGLDVERFQREFAGERVRQIVAEDIAAAEALGVDAVPAVYLDGRRVGPLAVDNPVFWRAVADVRRDHERLLGMND